MESVERVRQLPRWLVQVEANTALAEQLRRVLSELGADNTAIITGSGPTGRLAVPLIDKTRLDHQLLVVRGNTEKEAERCQEFLKAARADVVVAIGGGSVIDVAKRASLEDTLPVVVVPTLLSTDGIASPISVLKGETGQTSSLPAQLPTAVLASIEILATAPVSSLRAGMGDLLANRSAIADWRLAADAGHETADDFAILLAQVAADLVWDVDWGSDLEQRSPRLLKRLLEGLVLSGLAMELAGSSRPCSGAEHLISHSIDQLYPGKALHGEQVAFGTVVATALRAGDWRSVVRQLRAMGMDDAARGFGLDQNEIIEVLLCAAATRPDRYTVLDQLDLDSAAVRKVVAEVIESGTRQNLKGC